MQYRLLIFLSIIFLSSCSGSKKAARVEALQMEQSPAWVKARPVSTMYYIGIAKVNKKNYPENYTETAKKIALNDLASEISVNIQSSSIVSSFEDNSGFKSEFTRYIQMEMTKDLTAYQMQGSFETSEQYMVYYRLSKAKWAQIQDERKKAAADRSFNLFKQGEKEKLELNYASAIRSYINALLELKKYWNEAVYFPISEQKSRLDLAIRTNLISMLSEIQLVVQPQPLQLNIKNGFKEKLRIYVINKKGENLKNFPVRINYRKVSIPYQTVAYSKKEAVIVEIGNVKYKLSNNFVSAEIEKDKVLKIKSEDKKLLQFISDAFQVNPIETPVIYQFPKIYIQMINSDSPNIHYLKDAIMQSLGNQHYSFTNNKKDASLLLSINTHQSLSNANAEVKSSLLSYAIEVQNQLTKSIVYTYSSPKYKGVDYSIDAAKEKSFIKASEDITDSSFSDLLGMITN